MLGARRLDRINALAETIVADGGVALAVATDVTDAAQVKHLVDTAVDVFRTLGYVLSARALVLVFGLCGFAIAFVGALRESREVLFVFIAWNLLSVIPAIILEIVGRRRE